MESFILLAAGYFSKTYKGPTVAITLALVLGLTEAIYNSSLFSTIINAIDFHVYISIVLVVMMLMLKNIKAKVSFVVMLFCFLAMIVNTLSFWLDALGINDLYFFECSMYLIFSLEVLAVLRKDFTNACIGAANRSTFLRGLLRDFGSNHRGERLQ